jgi:hypothetical protein
MLLARIRSNVRESIWRYSQAHSFTSRAISAFLSTTSLALAQSPEDAHHLRTAVSDRNERQFLFARDLAVSDVSRASLFEPTGNVDRDFVAMMIPPGQAIIDMARAELLYGRNDELRKSRRDRRRATAATNFDDERSRGKHGVDANGRRAAGLHTYGKETHRTGRLEFLVNVSGRHASGRVL